MERWALWRDDRVSKAIDPGAWVQIPSVFVDRLERLTVGVTQYYEVQIPAVA